MAPQLFLYNTIVPVLAGSLKLFSRALPKLRAFFLVRKNLFAELEAAANAKDSSPRVWIHAASAGEFEQARPIIAEVKRACPDTLIFISFQSDSGYNVYQNYPDAETVFYHPVDTKKNAERTVALIKPDVLVVMRYDFWPNHLYVSKRHGATLILAAAVLQEHSNYFKPFIRQFYYSVFSLFDTIYTVSDEDRTRFTETFGKENVFTAGDPRFDQVLLRSHNTNRISHLKKHYTETTLLVAGSTWEKDENLLLPACVSLAGHLSMIIAPHDVSQNNIIRLESDLDSAGLSFARFSSFPDNFSADRILIIDSIGLLAELYALAKIAYVGGGFGINVHNTLEPAVYGIPVLFGPKHHNSPEAEALVETGGGTEVHNAPSLLDTLQKLVDNPLKRTEQGAIAGSYVKNRLGASKTVAQKILDTLNSLTK
ncbi:3-deoxy-D-manno-octulosonic acid transferase [Prosthecochloris sp. SCSIO W1101]|uniref:3-deoxy-D-manno-octulosonic acid transferase n=1 Tax=Prosthecochloris sp. SCSIO W1101 TaxID=2992242 RepID=UPI00223D837A|nr:glycosyltransferase N-terminal domain-containing protein [Prosthecochloris sp. SCSIO W1101]UZJ40779.1 3-deoxy-D-manno-octulosonic acid transferase [Prosthecochloris sp. SCSIO W1101]